MRRPYHAPDAQLRLRNGTVSAVGATGVSVDFDEGTVDDVPVIGATPAVGDDVRMLTTPYSILILGEAPRQLAGTQTVNGSSSVPEQVRVDFPAGYFPAGTPVTVVVSGAVSVLGSVLGAQAVSVDDSGFTLRIADVEGKQFSGTYDFHWIASVTTA